MFSIHSCFGPAARPALRLALGALVLAGNPQAHATFGDTLKVQGNSPIPSGWVILNVSHPFLGSMGKGLLPRPSAHVHVLTIMDVNDAPEGTELEVCGLTTLPPDWVLLRTALPAGMSKSKQVPPDWAATHTIKCMVKQPANAKKDLP